jgi:hypothetical protein
MVNVLGGCLKKCSLAKCVNVSFGKRRKKQAIGAAS